MQFAEIKLGHHICYRDEEKGITYPRFKGGIGWPHPPQPGLVLIVGEQYDPLMIRPPVRIVYEQYEKSLDNIARLCVSLQDVYHLASPWVAECENEEEGFRRYLWEWCDSQNKGDSNKKLSISLHQPSLTDDFPLMMARLERRIKDTALFTKPGGILESKIEALKTEDPQLSDLDQKYFEVTLLAQIVFEFDSSLFDLFKPKYVPQTPPSAMAV